MAGKTFKYSALVDKEKGRPVRKLELYSQDGRLLTSADTALKPRPTTKGAKALPAMTRAFS